jgi:hypothetical protein
MQLCAAHRDPASRTGGEAAAHTSGRMVERTDARTRLFQGVVAPTSGQPVAQSVRLFRRIEPQLTGRELRRARATATRSAAELRLCAAPQSEEHHGHPSPTEPLARHASSHATSIPREAEPLHAPSAHILTTSYAARPEEVAGMFIPVRRCTVDPVRTGQFVRRRCSRPSVAERHRSAARDRK